MKVSQKKVNKYAQKQGYDHADYLLEWKGYSCYDPKYKDNRGCRTGLPYRILSDSKWNLRLTTDKETMELLNYIVRNNESNHI